MIEWFFLRTDGMMSVQEFVSRIVNNTPPTPSASTPYRQLKRLHSTQPFDEGGRRIATPSALTSTIGMRLFSTLDDGTGYTAVECVLDAWMEEGIENSADILQMLNFSLDGKLSLGDLTMALENELLVTKNGIHQAAVASFKAEIRYLLECVDKELREKEKIQSDLEKAEKLKSQFATEVDEHHSAIEHMYNLNLRKLEQDHKEKLALVRSELMKEMDHIQQQASLQREELEAEVKRIRDDESFLRDHLSISVKENRRLEMEVLDSTEKLVEAQSQITKLQTNLDNIMKEKFGDLDPGSADLFLQEERIKQLRSSYEAQCRDLQDRIDELQSELQEFHSLGRVHQPSHKPLSEELESKSPGMESDPGIGSEEVQPFSLSLEAEMMLEQLKQQHLQEMEDLRNQLESKVSSEYKKQAKEREELENLQEEEVQTLRQQLLEAHAKTADLDEHLKTLEAQQEEANQNYATEMEELKKQHSTEMKKLEEKHKEELEARIEEERKNLQDDKNEWEKRLLHDTEREKEVLQQKYEDQLRARIDEVKLKFEEERAETVKSLTEQWQKERAELDERNSEALQALLEEEMLRLHYQNELKTLSERHMEQKCHWETQIQITLESAENQKRSAEETMKQEEERLNQKWTQEVQEIENVHKEIMEELIMKNEQLQNELDKFVCLAQTREIELSKQLNELHNRLQDSLETKDELLAQSERRVLEAEALLNQAVEDFQQERMELLNSHSELEAKHKEILSMSERQTDDRIKLMSERDDLKMKIEELEMFMKQAAADFDAERKELEGNISILEGKESLQQEVTLLHKKLRNANDKNHVLEMALTSSGLQNQSKKLYRDEMCRLMEQEKQLLKQENDKLQEELISVKADLVQSREKVRQLDVTVLCLKQHKQSQSAFVKELQQEIDALKQELETQEELTKVRAAKADHVFFWFFFYC
uniref:Ninein (GSK3B interacting protein) n=1 Tax=Sphaeramia orbicularis TaxID=375764 RepID=A0A673B3X8_9TELE